MQLSVLLFKRVTFTGFILFIFVMFAVLSVCTASSAEGDLVWAKMMSGNNLETGNDVAADSFGNVYTVGDFRGTVDFDPGDANFLVSSNVGQPSTFISKLDNTGNLIWAKGLVGAGSSYNHGFAITVDPSGNVYTTGYFSGTVDFDPGENTQQNITSAGIYDIYISKLDADGNFVWVKTIGGASARSVGQDIVLDSLGNIYLTGYFWGSADFDPDSVDEFNVTSVSLDDIFICKLDSGGDLIWVKTMGGAAQAHAFSITLDSSDNVYTTGRFMGTVDFDPGEETAEATSAGDWDIYINKLDSNGNYVWAKTFGSANYDTGVGIDLDKSGNIHVSGTFSDTVDFDPGTGTHEVVSNGQGDIVIIKLSNAGEFMWVKTMGGASWDEGLAIKVDNAGNVFTSGYFFDDEVDFDPGAGTFNITSPGWMDTFIVKLDRNGNFIWANAVLGLFSNRGNSIFLDPTGSILLTGSFEGTTDFDPGENTFELTSSEGTQDIYVLRLKREIASNFPWILVLPVLVN